MTRDADRLDDIGTAIRSLIEAFDRNQVAVLFGAGLSADSGLPLANQLVEAILSAAGANAAERQVVVNAGLPFEAFLDAVADHSSIAELWKIFGRGKPNQHHERLVEFVRAGKLRHIATTNFDCLFEDAFASRRRRPGLTGPLTVKTKWADSEALFESSGKATLVKLHGSVEAPETMALTMRQIAAKQIRATTSRAIERLFANGDHEVVLLLGYSASDSFDIMPAIRQLGRTKRVLWVVHDPKGPVRVVPLASAGARFGQHISGSALHCDTDLFMTEVARGLGIASATRSASGQIWMDCVATWAGQALATYGTTFGKALLGRVLADALRPDLALPHCTSAAGAPPTDSARHAKLLNQLGATLANCGIAEEGHQRLVQALELLRAGSDRRQEACCLCDIGQNHANVGHFSVAAHAFEHGFAIAKTIDDRSLMARNAGGVGACHASLGAWGDALFWLDNAVRYAEEIGDKTCEGTALVNAARVYSELGDHTTAGEYYASGSCLLEAMLGRDNPVVAAAQRLYRSHGS